MLAFYKSVFDWIKNAFFKEETKIVLVGLQKSGKTTFLDTVLVSKPRCKVICLQTSIVTELLLCKDDRTKTSLDGSTAVDTRFIKIVSMS